jgi:hypothetical protein
MAVRLGPSGPRRVQDLTQDAGNGVRRSEHAAVKLEADTRSTARAAFTEEPMNLLTKANAQNLSLYVEREGTVTYVSDRAGLRPLLRGVTDFPGCFDGAVVVDRVVGLAAAYLLIHGKVKRVITPLVTEDGATALEDAGVQVDATQRVERLLDDRRHDLCPMEAMARQSGGFALFVHQLQRHLAG